MPLYEFSRRILPNPQQTPLCWSMWWRAAKKEGQGLHIEIALSHLLTGNPWIVDDVTGDKALAFFGRLPGWMASDEHGTPITLKRLSPLEEHQALKESGFSGEDRAKLVEALTCPLSASRTTKRAAERAFRKLIEMQHRKAVNL